MRAGSRRRAGGQIFCFHANIPKFAVNGNRSCAELATVHQLCDEGWRSVWVCAYGPRELRSE